jgi:hypothetical protein
MLPELDGTSGVVVGDPFHGQQRGTASLAEGAGLRGRRVLGAHALGRGRQPDPRRPEQFVQAVLLQHLDAQVNEGGGQEVVHQGDGLAVGHPDPLQRVHQRALGQLQGLSDPVAGVDDLVPDHLRGRGPAGGREVVIQAGQLDVAVNALVGNLSPGAALSDHEALVRQVQERGPHRGTRHAQPLGELHLVLQPRADLERAGPDGRLVVLRQLEVQRHRAGPVDGDRRQRAGLPLRCHARHAALHRCRRVPRGVLRAASTQDGLFEHIADCGATPV